MKKWEAKEKLKALIADELGPQQPRERPDPQTRFEWFVEHRYLPMRERPLASGDERQDSL